MAYDPTIVEARGVREITLKASNTAVPGTLLGYSSGWCLADADARIKAELIALDYGVGGSVIHAAPVATLWDRDAPFTAGDAQWLSATAGAYTATKPALSTTLTLHQKIGKALDTETLQIDLDTSGPMCLAIQVSINPASIAATTKTEQSVTATGALATDFVIVQAPASVENDLVVGHARAAADTIEVAFANIDNTNAVDGAALTWAFLLLRFA